MRILPGTLISSVTRVLVAIKWISTAPFETSTTTSTREYQLGQLFFRMLATHMSPTPKRSERFRPDVQRHRLPEL
jgi:hypothetical protein